jgi:hypothetical protein
MSQLLSPLDLRKIAQEAENEEHKLALAARRKAEAVADDLRRSFEARDIAPEAADRINKAVSAAAQRGEHEILILRFPAKYCKDGGQRINNFERDWPDSLTGFARRAFDYYDRELRPLGFSLRAEIMNFPDGNMGDAGLYLRW